MAAEMVFSAVVEETLEQALSGLIGGSGGQEEDVVRDVERLEVARIRLEAALEASRRWRIHDAPLLRWNRSHFPAAWRAPPPPPSSAAAAFKWYADGAGKFLRFVELGGGGCSPRVDPLIGRLLAGDELRYRWFANRPGGKYLQFFVRPMIRLDDDGRGVEAPEAKNLCLGAILRLSESTDLVGTLVRCLELLLLATPHFRPVAESARRELVVLPRQDFSLLG